jgi:hypothetical protein
LARFLTLVTLALLAAGTVTLGGQWRPAGYTQSIGLTTSFLLLMVFLTTEALKHFPVGRPFATGPADASLIPVRVGLLIGYAAMLGRQFWKIHGDHVFDARVERFLALSRAAA